MQGIQSVFSKCQLQVVLFVSQTLEAHGYVGFLYKFAITVFPQASVWCVFHVCGDKIMAFTLSLVSSQGTGKSGGSGGGDVVHTSSCPPHHSLPTPPHHSLPTRRARLAW